MPNNNNIDERIVEMRIDNRQFVDGAEKTIGVLDRLKQALNFKNADDGFTKIQKSVDKVDLASMSNSVDLIADRFTNLGIVGQQVIRNLTDSIYGFVSSTVKGLTIDPVTGGFNKYEEILRKTQVIMSATRNEVIPERFGTQLEYVENQLDLLAWYTDETSYNLEDMVSNVSKFVNAGIPLEDSVLYMQGITNWASSAGASVQEASRAMYNLSQAMAVGVVKLMDWRSIENANMATREFKQTAIETAVAMGTLKEVGDGVYKTLDGTTVSVNNFNEGLSDGWFTANVLKSTLDTYGAYSRRLGAVMDDMGLTDAGITTAELMEWMDQLENGEMTLEEWHDILADSMVDPPHMDALMEAFKLLSDEELEISKRAFQMGQEYKTFSDVIDATKDAVSTAWMKTFRAFIGDANEAKELWTAVGDAFNDIFVSGSTRRNAILQSWNSVIEIDGKRVKAGRYYLLESLKNIYEAVVSFVKPIKTAFDNIFSWGTAEEAGKKLLNFTRRFRFFTSGLKLSKDAQIGMTKFFEAIFSGIKNILSFFKPVAKVFTDGLMAIKNFVNLFFESFSTGKFDKDRFLSGLPKIFDSIQKSIGHAWESIKNFFSSFSDIPIVKSIFNFITSSIDFLIGKIGTIFTSIKNTKVEISGIEKPIDSIKGWLASIWNYVSGIEIDTDAIKRGLGKIGEIISTIYEGLVGDPKAFKEKVANLATNAIEAVKEVLGKISLSDIFEGARLGILGYVGIQFGEFVSGMKDGANSFKKIPESIAKTFDTLSDTIESYGKAQNANTMLKMAASMLILAAAIVILSKVPQDRFAMVSMTLAAFFYILSKIAENISSNESFSNNKNNMFVKVLPEFAANLIAIAILLAVVAGVLIKLKDLSGPDIWKGLGVILVTLLLAAGTLVGLSKLMDKDVDPKAIGKLLSVSILIYAVGKALSKLKDLSSDQLIMAGIGISFILAAVALIAYASKDIDTKTGVAMFIGMIGIVGVILALIPMLITISRFDWPTFGRVALLMIVIFGALAGLMYVVGKAGEGGGALKGAAAFVIIAAALLMIAASLAIALPAILAFSFGMIKFMDTMDDMSNYGRKIRKLAGLGVVLFVFGIGLMAVSSAAFIFAAAVLVAGAGFALMSTGLLAIASAVTILTAVLIPFGEVLVAFCKLIAENGDVLVKTITVILGAIVVALVAKKMEIALGVVAIIGAIVLAIIQYGPQILTALGVILLKVLEFMLVLIPMLVIFAVSAIIILINETANAIRSNKAAIISALENLVSSVLELLMEVVFRMLGDVASVIIQQLGMIFGLDLSDYARELSDNIAGLGSTYSRAVYLAFGGAEREASSGSQGIVDAFSDSFGGSAEELEETIGVLSSYVEGSSSDAEETASEGGSGIIGALADGMTGNSDAAGEAMSGVISAATGGIDMTSIGESMGSNWIAGVISGASGGGGLLSGAFSALAGEGVDTWATQWMVNSPSKVAEELGRYWDLGIIKGLENDSDGIMDASEDTSSKFTEAIRTAMENIALLSDEDFAINPVITPVVDMTNVEESANRVNDIFSNASANAGRIASRMSQSSEYVASAAGRVQGITQNRTEISQDSYTINVYPSEGQSEEDIANYVIDYISRKGVALG